MSLALPVTLGIASAIAYGGSTAVQHAAAFTGTGDTDLRGLTRLLRDPRWLLSILGDALGLALQVAALATGPVTVVQPLLILCLPVALPVRAWLGGPRPTGMDAWGCVAVLTGLGLFFVLIGDPGSGTELSTTAAVWTGVVVLLVTAALLAASWRARPMHRAIVIGAVAGALFGVVGVLINGVSTGWGDHGMAALGRSSGAIPLVELLILGGVGFVLVQLGFQVGPLGASFPANLIADPVVAVLLGALLLHQHVPTSLPHLVGYLASLVLVGWGVVELANPRQSRRPGDRMRELPVDQPE